MFADGVATEYELFRSEFKAAALEWHSRLRESQPVARTPSGYWLVSRYADVRAVLTDHGRFSAAPIQAETLRISTDAAGNPDYLERLFTIVADMPVPFDELLTAKTVIAADPPDHTRLRQIVNRAFTPRQVSGLVSQIDRLAAGYLAEMDVRQPFSLVERVASPLPLKVICDLLDVADEDYAMVKRWTERFSAAGQGSDRNSEQASIALLEVLREFAKYFVPRIEERRSGAPKDDVITKLMRAEGADVMSTVETMLFIFVMMAAGHETVTSVIGNTIVSLYQNPDQLQMVVERPELVPNAIEESLRYSPPVHFVFRAPYEPVEITGVTIPAGEVVVSLILAANRDPRQFPDPDRFDITRDATGHLGFGHGIHHCLGAHLGKLEATRVILALLPYLPGLRLSDRPLEQTASHMVTGWKDVVLEPKG